jgi:hypothetical protein
MQKSNVDLYLSAMHRKKLEESEIPHILELETGP